jgi:hypothetical protein
VIRTRQVLSERSSNGEADHLRTPEGDWLADMPEAPPVAGAKTMA